MIVQLFKSMQRAKLNSQIIFAELQLEQLKTSNNDKLIVELEEHIKELKAELESLC